MSYYLKSGFDIPAKEPNWCRTIYFVDPAMDEDEYSLEDLMKYVKHHTNASENVKAFWDDVYENEIDIRIVLNIDCEFVKGWRGDQYLQPDDPDEVNIVNYKLDIFGIPEYVSDNLEKEIYISSAAYIQTLLADIGEDILLDSSE